MKKILSGALAFVMCFNVVFFAAACGDKDEKGDTNSQETVIDFDTGKYTPSEYFSIELTYNTQPIKKSSSSIAGMSFVDYSSTGTITVRIEPLAGYRMRAEGVRMEIALHTSIPSESDQVWKFSQGGKSNYNYQIKDIVVSLSGNGTATATESIKLDFILDFSSSVFFNENSIHLSPYWECTSKYIHGKIYLTK